jgi:hypothetical protein
MDTALLSPLHNPAKVSGKVSHRWRVEEIAPGHPRGDAAMEVAQQVAPRVVPAPGQLHEEELGRWGCHCAQNSQAQALLGAVKDEIVYCRSSCQGERDGVERSVIHVEVGGEQEEGGEGTAWGGGKRGVSGGVVQRGGGILQDPSSS